MSTYDDLVARDAAAWRELVVPLGRGDERPLDPELAAALLDAAPFDEWLSTAERALQETDEFLMIGTPIRRFRQWFIASSLATLPDGDARRWPIRRYQLMHDPSRDGGYAEARSLLEELKAAGAPKGEFAEVALLVVKGSFVERELEAALEHATLAENLFTTMGDHERASVAARQLGAAHLYLHNLEQAFQCLQEPMKRRGPLFGGGGTHISRKAPDEIEEAISEAATIASWAESSTPEWVRAVGGMAERWKDPAEAELLWRQFEKFLSLMLDNGQNHESDIEVVVRHSGQRGLTRTPLRALERYIERFPDDEWAERQVEIIERHVEVDDIIARLKDQPEESAERLQTLFDSFSTDGTLGEDSLSFRVVDALTNHYLESGDERAIEVQRRVLDHKLAAFGECPAAWLEEQNLGTVYAQLGRGDEALATLESALRKQVEYFGDDHPAPAMTRRNIERLR